MADYFGSTLTDLQSAKTAQLGIEEETRRQAAAQLFQIMNAAANRNEARRTGDLDRGLRSRTLDEEMAYRGRELGLRGRVADNEFDLGGRRIGIDQGRNEIEDWKVREAAAAAAEDRKARERIEAIRAKAIVDAAEADAKRMDPRFAIAGVRTADDVTQFNHDAETLAMQANSMLKPHLDEFNTVITKNPGWNFGGFYPAILKGSAEKYAADAETKFKTALAGIEGKLAGQPVIFNPTSRRFVPRPRPVPNYFDSPAGVPQAPVINPYQFFGGAPANPAPAGRAWRRIGPPAQ